LCGTGAASTVKQSDVWSWTCAGLDGGKAASCSAKLATSTGGIDGICGAANGQTLSDAPAGTTLCGAGTASAVKQSGGWTWTCVGLDGGKVASCSAKLATSTGGVDGVCGAANGKTLSDVPSGDTLCGTGTASAVKQSDAWTWTCAGLDGGKAASCSAKPATAASTAVCDGTETSIPPERRIAWKPGLQGGIPNYPVGLNVRDGCGGRGTVGDGVADDTAAIQRCIDAVGVDQAVYLPAGTYLTSSPLRLKSRMVLRGESNTRARITMVSSKLGDIVQMVGKDWGADTAVVAGTVQGSTSLTVENADNIAVGDYVQIRQSNGEPLVETTGCEGECTWCTDSVSQIVRVAGKSAKVITIDRPLYTNYSPELHPKLRKMAPVLNAGVEDLYLERVTYVENIEDTSNVSIRRSVGCWVKNIESAKAVGYHVRIQASHSCEIRDSYMHHGHNYSSRGYGIVLIDGTTDALVENNVLHILRHAMLIAGGGQGNVFGYNCSKDPLGSSTELYGDIVTHGAHPMMNLWESNVAAHVDLDFVWGSSSHNTVFRNWIERRSSPPGQTIKSGFWAVQVQAHNTYENIVGNVLCYEGCPADDSVHGIWRIGYACSESSVSDTKVAETMLRYGNYDYLTHTTQWDAKGPQCLPASLYLTTQPRFLANRPWPLIGSDLDPLVNTIPACERFAALQ
jgi:hypothetical protein